MAGPFVGVEAVPIGRPLVGALTAAQVATPEAPEPHEPLGVLVAEAVGGVVGGQAIVVEAHRAAASGHPTPPGLEVQAHLARDVALGARR